MKNPTVGELITFLDGRVAEAVQPERSGVLELDVVELVTRAGTPAAFGSLLMREGVTPDAARELMGWLARVYTAEGAPLPSGEVLVRDTSDGRVVEAIA